ncbi:MAG: glutathione S-transferase [Gammaproteobacteria bacterium]
MTFDPMPYPLPVLYSFRRCPYAIRARMTLKYAATPVELREVVLREMPDALLDCSPKATVPVLVLPDGRVLEESRDIMHWALRMHDPDGWLPGDAVQLDRVNELIDENDQSFKLHLDRYKYPERYPAHAAACYRTQGEVFLQRLNARLDEAAWLAGARMTVADVAIFPFIRQFAQVDRDWFDQTPYQGVQRWLQGFLEADLFTGVMQKYPRWQAGDAVTHFP